MLRWDLSCAYSYCLQASNNQLHVTSQEWHLFAISMDVYYMALSHKDWELPNSRIWLAEIDIESGLDFPI